MYEYTALGMASSFIALHAGTPRPDAGPDSPSKFRQPSLPSSNNWHFWPSPSQPSQPTEPQVTNEAAKARAIEDSGQTSKPKGLGGTALAPRKPLNGTQHRTTEDRMLPSLPSEPLQSQTEAGPVQRSGFLSAWGWQVNAVSCKCSVPKCW